MLFFYLLLLMLPVIGFSGEDQIGYKPLQPLIDAAEPNGVVIPEPGIYAGPITIDKPLTLDGRDQVTINAGGKGSVIYLKTNGATVKNLHLVNTGESHNDIDSGVQVRGNFNVVKDNVIE
ncbi:MAG: nitrous oxide reductase family maturation protein NosD, partial [Candidatus Sedimenticola sp. 6PFRAG7]